ncbi:MAG TPA: 4-(cytidine 5'-diphospho)-2-C-methyl-D-erythritol kinase [Bacteroidota bacterium]
MIRAYAKINLGLQILGRRRDGFHDIQTILHPVDIFDEISFDRCDDVCVDCDNPEVPTGSSNVCVRAAAALRDSLGTKKGVRIELKKKIPVSAGLGGGSSDAAAVLNHLPRYWGIDVSPSALRQIAEMIGSDVPYFLRRGTALATGRGEVLEFLDFRLPYWVIVLFPGIPISTKWAYENIRPNPSVPVVDLKRLMLENRTRPNVLVNALRNDFEPLVFRTHETVMRAKESLYRGGADFALMSGSGSAVFGLFQDEVYARDIVNRLRDRYQTFLTGPNFAAPAD